jgi:DnaJ-class molecular chaperone
MYAFPPACRPARACASPDTATPARKASRPAIFTSSRKLSRTLISNVTVTEAALGAKIEVPTLDGRSLLRVPPGTSSGQKLRLREKGMPSVRQPGKRGDLYVTLQVMVPKPVDERVRDLLRELAKLEPEDPRGDLFARAAAPTPA